MTLVKNKLIEERRKSRNLKIKISNLERRWIKNTIIMKKKNNTNLMIKGIGKLNKIANEIMISKLNKDTNLIKMMKDLFNSIIQYLMMVMIQNLKIGRSKIIFENKIFD